MNNETQTLDRLFLELSQFTKARTRRELDLEATLREVHKQLTEDDGMAGVTRLRCLNISNSVLS